MSDSVMQNAAGLPETKHSGCSEGGVALSLGRYGAESRQTPLLRQKYRATVPGSLAPGGGHFRPTLWNHIKGKRRKGKEAEARVAKQTEEEESWPVRAAPEVGPQPALGPLSLGPIGDLGANMSCVASKDLKFGGIP